MKKETVRFTILCGLLLLAGLVQFLNMTLFGVMPDAALVVLVLSALFVRDIWHELLLVSCASFLFKFSPVANREIFIFFAIGLVMIVIARKLPWHLFVNGIFLILSATMAMYVLIDPQLISSLIFAKELGYNIILMCIFYYGLIMMGPFRNVQ